MGFFLSIRAAQRVAAAFVHFPLPRLERFAARAGIDDGAGRAGPHITSAPGLASCRGYRRCSTWAPYVVGDLLLTCCGILCSSRGVGVLGAMDGGEGLGCGLCSESSDRACGSRRDWRRLGAAGKSPRQNIIFITRQFNGAFCLSS